MRVLFWAKAEKDSAKVVQIEKVSYMAMSSSSQRNEVDADVVIKMVFIDMAYQIL